MDFDRYRRRQLWHLELLDWRRPCTWQGLQRSYGGDSKEIVTLIDDMLETMYEANGVGLAAPQVGILKRIVVIDVGEEVNRDD